MSAVGPLAPLALCESCWLVENTKWEPESIDENGRVFVRLVGVGMPATLGTDAVEICCMCGELTVVGIYVLRDPEVVPFPDAAKGSDFGFEVGIDEIDGVTEDDLDEDYPDDDE